MRSYRLKLMIFITIAILITSMILGVSSFLLGSQKIGALNRSSSETLTREIVENLNEYLNGLARSIDYMASDANVIDTPSNEDSREWMYRSFDNYVSKYTDVLYIYVGYNNKEMNIHPFVELSEGYDPTERPWYQDALKNEGVVWTDIYIDDASKQPIVTVAKEVTDSSGNSLGVIGADVELSIIQALYSEVTVGNTGYIFVTDSAGNVISHPDTAQLGTSVTELEFWSDMVSEQNG